MAHLTSCACLALYGCSSNLSPEAWFEHARQYFDFLGLQPSVCVLEQPDGRSRSLKWKTACDRMGQHTALQSMSCYVEAPGANNLMQWRAVASWSKPLHSPLPTVFFGYREDVGRFAAQTCELLSKLIIDHDAVGYGVGYTRDARLGPEAYALGMIVKLDDKAPEAIEKRRIGLWWREFLAPRDDEPPRFRHLGGMFRDVYPVSILGRHHLSQRIAGDTLEQWIQSSPSRGVLTQIGASNWLWNLTDGDRVEIREALLAAGVVIADEQRRTHAKR